MPANAVSVAVETCKGNSWCAVLDTYQSDADSILCKLWCKLCKQPLSLYKPDACKNISDACRTHLETTQSVPKCHLGGEAESDSYRAAAAFRQEGQQAATPPSSIARRHCSKVSCVLPFSWLWQRKQALTVHATHSPVPVSATC